MNSDRGTYKIRRGKSTVPGMHGPVKWQGVTPGNKVEIWLDCTKCDKSIGLEAVDGGLRWISNEQARDIFTAEGWSVLPTLCPEHQERTMRYCRDCGSNNVRGLHCNDCGSTNIGRWYARLKAAMKRMVK